ncbi:MAG: cupin domain-containing protein [Bacteroidota bacterium]
MKTTVAEALQKLGGSNGALFVKLMEHGRMSVEIYRPVEIDRQTPHLQDELYVVISGTGEFLNNGTRSAFGPGDILFVPAGVEHRFENFSDDFATWVIFYGPDGGEGSREF